MTTTEYEQKVMQWRSEREATLRRENGWLALAGLFWLREGENRIGSGPDNDILLPRRFPGSLGSIRLEDKQTSLKLESGQVVDVNGSPVEAAVLHADIEEDPSFISLDDMRMVVIKRPNGIGVRLWDNQRTERQTFPGREWFPVNEGLRLEARYTRHATPRVVLVPDVFGAMLEAKMHGELSFNIQGQPFTLQASEDPDGGLEVHFQDLTNGKSTYPSGRYLYLDEPVHEGSFTLDFNYAYNPPCAFTAFATCAFAPQENQLPVPIEAGEKYNAHH
jgi:uncharacterized protein (DUF1684 family)